MGEVWGQLAGIPLLPDRSAGGWIREGAPFRVQLGAGAEAWTARPWHLRVRSAFLWLQHPGTPWGAFDLAGWEGPEAPGPPGCPGAVGGGAPLLPASGACAAPLSPGFFPGLCLMVSELGAAPDGKVDFPEDPTPDHVAWQDSATLFSSSVGPGLGDGSPWDDQRTREPGWDKAGALRLRQACQGPGSSVAQPGWAGSPAGPCPAWVAVSLCLRGWSSPFPPDVTNSLDSRSSVGIIGQGA